MSKKKNSIFANGNQISVFTDEFLEFHEGAFHKTVYHHLRSHESFIPSFSLVAQNQKFMEVKSGYRKRVAKIHKLNTQINSGDLISFLCFALLCFAFKIKA